ncbi:MAG: 4-hydroxy-tetrahydrodipicolinate reductase [Proteobacteria bacterium SW_6_67_9]|nr:MAG: 4-hydroxy-tetrahydrodipicolinate reductase [Proteobacteria bacterium SW_6_67_9]
MTRVAIQGASGRMGRNLVAACLDQPNLECSAAIVPATDSQCGHDAGIVAGRDPIGIPLSETIDAPTFDVAVDFSRPDGTLELAQACRHAGRPVVIGTTGFSPEQRAQLGSLARDIPVVLAPNTGIGVNVVYGLVGQAARALQQDYDVEVIEAHHRHKVDAPSGTALRLGEAAAEARGQRFDDQAVLSREGHTGERETATIGFATVRGGEIVGEHTVLFAGEAERIEITHRAQSRSVFAQGAMRAAAWIADRTPGLYDMQDVLGLSGR